jgi:hypothetical protein
MGYDYCINNQQNPSLYEAVLIIYPVIISFLIVLSDFNLTIVTSNGFWVNTVIKKKRCHISARTILIYNFVKSFLKDQRKIKEKNFNYKKCDPLLLVISQSTHIIVG